jgi:phosphohistidine phosphatase
MKLYLVQHGDALNKDVDPEKALSEKGHSDVVRLAAFLRGRVQVSHVVHSGKTRARQTAELLAASVAADHPVDSITGINPNDATDVFAHQLVQRTEDILVVGHLPFMGRLVARLINGSEEKIVVEYRPGSIVCLELSDAARWLIQWMIRPDMLGEG